MRSPRRLRLTAIVSVIVALLAALLPTVVTAPAANAAALTALTMTNTDITLTESGTMTFSGTAPSGTASTHLTATFATGTASYTVDGGSSTALASDVASDPITINDGLTTVVVTHSDGGTDTTYTVYVKKVRPLTGISVRDSSANAVTLVPAFDPAVFSYTVTVPYSSTTVDIAATWDATTNANATGFEYCIDTGATGVTQTPGDWATTSTLNVGSNYRNLLLLTNTPQGWVGGCTSGTPQRYTLIIVREPALSSSTISALSLTDANVSLSDGTAPYSFTGTAPSGSTATHLTATFSTGTASYSVDGGSSVALTSGVASGSIPLNDGLTTITVTHVGTTTTTYTIYVKKVRPLTDIEVEGATLSPAFDPAVFSYTVTVPYTSTTARIRANWDTTLDANVTGLSYCIDTGATGVTQTPLDWATLTSLSVGGNYRNLIVVTTTPQGVAGGCTSGTPQRYTVNVIREDALSASTISALSLTDTNVSLSNGSVPYSYTGTAQTGSTQTHVNATFTTGTASYSVDGAASIDLTSATPSAAIPLNDGLTTITVTHVGSTTTTYTIYVTKVRQLTGIEVEGATLDPAFDPDVYSYSAVLPNATESTRVRARWDTTTDANATGFNYCIDTGATGVDATTPDEWATIPSLSVGANYRNLLLQTNTPQGWVGGCTSGFPQRYTVIITRASAFSTIGGVSTNAPAVETPIDAGTTITATPSGVTGTPTPTVTYDWEAADAPTDPFVVVATTTEPTWTPDNTVAGKYLRVTAEAKNGVSIDASTTSSVFGPIAGVAEAPSISSVTVSGTARVGSSLTASVSASGYPVPTLAYSWESAATAGGSYSVISGATASSYTPTSGDVGRYLRVSVTASNTSGADATATSSATSVVTAAPVTDSGTSGSGSPSATERAESVVASTPAGGYRPGTSTATVGGVPTSVQTTVDPATRQWSVTGGGVNVTFAPQGIPATGPIPAVDDFRVPQGGFIDIAGSGYRPGTAVNAFLVADDSRSSALTLRDRLPAVSLGSADVLSDGSFALRADIPQQTDIGAYVIQVDGTRADGSAQVVNIGTDVLMSPAAARETTSSSAAFFKGGSADLSGPGKKKLRQLIAGIPAGTSDIRLDVLAVAVGKKSLRTEQRLATKRARALVAFFTDRGVNPSTSIATFTSANVDKAQRREFQRSSKGHPLSTVRMTTTAPGVTSQM